MNRFPSNIARHAAIIIACVTIVACGSHRKIEKDRPTQPAITQKPTTKPQPKIEEKPVRPPFVQKHFTTTSGTKWGDIDYDDEPWVSNTSRPIEITRGLQNRHFAIWQSHGRYYDREKGFWKWQRPQLFGTTEDLYTQTIVVPYLIPMLELAGANVFTPRERDWQKHEVIIDNDDLQRAGTYTESSSQHPWLKGEWKGFARHQGVYHDGENPFEAGSYRQIKATKNESANILYCPRIPEAGKYAVYVSYQSLQESVPDARYEVIHQGISTTFSVNQQMGGGTWVYLGTFDFDEGCSLENCVRLSNQSKHQGLVTADAVRFGGGMGNIERGGVVSGLPRFAEGARYYAQWAGMPYSIYGGYQGQHDYNDDINTRSKMTNFLGGGSPYMPSQEGLGVPFELSLAVHSDAGYAKDFTGLTGSLGVCTTDYHDGLLNSGLSRQASSTLIRELLNSVENDLSKKYGQWVVRALWDKNYSETRLPEVPSAILEMLSHQNFPDMVMGQDPNFKFTLARSVYKALLKFSASTHGKSYTVAPLPPQFLSVEIGSDNTAILKWRETVDEQESTARPTSYIIYQAIGTGGFNNGTVVDGTSAKIKLQPGIVYSFKISAVNRGGESFPSEVLSTICQPEAKQTVLVVSGFHRLAAPAIVNNDSLQGFDFNRDPGVSYMRTAGWCGRQVDFNKRGAGMEGPGALGYSGTEWQGQVLAGNTFDYVRTHANAISHDKTLNVCSCSSYAIESGSEDLGKYHCVDLILGLEKYDARQLVYYKTFTPKMQQALAAYARTGGAILVSGSYVGSDMTSDAERNFLSSLLHLEWVGNQLNNPSGLVNGLGTNMEIYRQINEKHYAAIAPEIIQATGNGFSAMTYSDNTSAAVAYQGTDYRAFTIGFPFECIKSPSKQASIMGGILRFLLP